MGQAKKSSFDIYSGVSLLKGCGFAIVNRPGGFEIQATVKATVDTDLTIKLKAGETFTMVIPCYIQNEDGPT